MSKSRCRCFAQTVATARTASGRLSRLSLRPRYFVRAEMKVKRSFKPVGETKEERQAYVAQKTKEAFKKAGYGDVTPREDVLTYGKFLEKGLRVKAGQKAVKVGTLRLFHISQCEAV